MTSSQITMWIARGPEEDKEETLVAIDYESDAYGTRVAHYGEPLDGSAPIKLTPAEIERATDRAYQDWAEERYAAS